MNNSIIHVTDSSFEEDVLKSEAPVMVDYWGGVVRPMQDDCANPG